MNQNRESSCIILLYFSISLHLIMRLESNIDRSRTYFIFNQDKLTEHVSIIQKYTIFYSNRVLFITIRMYLIHDLNNGLTAFKELTYSMN